MKIPKYFLEWFRSYGLLDDGWTDMGLGVQNRIKRIAWRAYRRGILDTKIKYDIPIPKDEAPTEGAISTC